MLRSSSNLVRRFSTNIGNWSLGGHPHATSMGIYNVPPYKNEPFLHFAPGSKERDEIRVACAKYRNLVEEIPLVIGGKVVRTGRMGQQVLPTDHQHVMANWHKAGPEEYKLAIENALAVRPYWEAMPLEDRAAIFLKAADRIASIYRMDINALTMLNIGKTAWQSELDSIAELVDFFRFGAQYAFEINRRQPNSPESGAWNRQEYRSLEGFILAICPFNFIAIAANLAFSPAIMGNVIIWKPADTAVQTCWRVYQILVECGLPDGVIQFVPGDAVASSQVSLMHKSFAGLHFTGSTNTFNHLYKMMGDNISTYRGYPRVVGETGGKNFHFVHESADVESVANHTVRSAFEYSGQKCSACSRIYIPSNLWPQLKELLIEKTKQITMGQPDDLSNFMTSVISRPSFDKITSYIERAKRNKCKLLVGGTSDDSRGYFISPTIFQTTDPHYETMVDELFGPVLTVYVYEPSEFKEMLKICDETSNYALCGAIFAQDRIAQSYMLNAFRHTAGNFYVNDKSTGSVVGSQPFGGGRGSGTNDKSGSVANLTRWTNARSIKETFLPQRTWDYPHMLPDKK